MPDILSDEAPNVPLTISNAESIAWHLEQGEANGGLSKVALAAVLRRHANLLRALQQERDRLARKVKIESELKEEATLSDNGMPTSDEITLAELTRIQDENYSDLLDQMDEAWGKNFGAIGGTEIRAFLESRIVHKPAKRLRAQLSAAQAERDRAELHRAIEATERDKLAARVGSLTKEAVEDFRVKAVEAVKAKGEEWRSSHKHEAANEIADLLRSLESETR